MNINSNKDFSSWDDSFKLGIHEIDRQHKGFFDLMENVSISSESAINEDFGRIINELEDYSVYHFEFEEKMMEDENYPHLEQHKKEHQFFKTKLDQFRLEGSYSNPLVFKRVLEFMRKWWMSHILECDMEYSHHILKY